MKKIISLAFMMLLAVAPVFAQKLSKEEKAARAKAQYESAVQCIEGRNFVIVPTQYMDSDNVLQTNNDNARFFSCEGKQFFIQGAICGGDNNTPYVAEDTEYTVTKDKKGNIKLRILVNGRKVRGTYTISVRTSGNFADVIYTPPTGSVRKFSGPLVPVKEANYNKRSNPM